MCKYFYISVLFLTTCNKPKTFTFFIILGPQFVFISVLLTKCCEVQKVNYSGIFK